MVSSAEDKAMGWGGGRHEDTVASKRSCLRSEGGKNCYYCLFILYKAIGLYISTRSSIESCAASPVAG